MLDKKYDFKTVESGKYDNWLKHDYFKSGDLSKEPFCIVIPPPNVTGKLHLGHAWDTTLQDIIIRYKRMDGFDALWVPGMDHAGIATQAKVDQKLKAMGYNPRAMARDDWLKYAWEWKQEYANDIHEQWKRLGLSLDYSKERFTLDEGLNEAVNQVFIDYYQKGYIYRGERIINWDPEAMTALSNEEVIYKDTKGAFYYLKYYLADSDDYLEIATTRPETLFGDTAIAVNKDDKRYQQYIGKQVRLPLVNRLIPVIADEHADQTFGTGVVKITPAHDPNDFEVGLRHHLERIICINPDGTMNDKALKYEGMDRFACREALVSDLKEEGLLIKVEPIVHSVGYSERTDVMVEPYLSKQWFVKMDKLAKQVLANQQTDQKVKFIPPRMEKILNHWMSNCHDWCISRQLWWGHRIPAWYKDTEIKVQKDCPGEGWVQDADVLDTWFSSALWPFSSLGWPKDTASLKRYFPTSVLVTGYDIIFFWVARMMFQSLELTKEVPFKELVIHGLIRDKDGRKMSKSLGNGVDPMEVIDQYGCDALRYFLATSSAPGLDMRFDDDKMKATWNFINKLWNASRFTLMNLESWDNQITFDHLKESDKWILTKLNLTIKKVRHDMDKYQFNVVGSELYDFIWNDFCDWYIELAKIEMDNTTKSVLEYVLTAILKMLHPFMPFVTEEIYLKLPHHDESIMISAYPKVNKAFNFQSNLDELIALIKHIRKLKVDYQLQAYDLVTTNSLVTNNVVIIERLVKPTNIIATETKALTRLKITDDISLYYDNQPNLEEAKANLLKEEAQLTASIHKRTTLLANPNYVTKAPKALVASEESKLKEEHKQLEVVKDKLKLMTS